MGKREGRKEELWKKYLAGQATRQELVELEVFLSAVTPDEILSGLEYMGKGSLKDNPTGISMPERMADRLREQLRQYATRSGGEKYKLSPVPPSPANPFHRNRMVRWMAAASLMILVLGGFLFLTHNKRAGFFAGKDHSGFSIQNDSYTWDSILNAGSTARLVTLSDQTKIWLNKNTILLVNKNYESDRKVRIKGEGYFDVTKNEQHPFRVEAGNVETVVLGTTFNIDNNADQSEVYIGLVKGSVKVQHSGNDPVTLSPGETAITGRKEGHITTVRTGVQDIGGWINGDLVFNQLPLAEALVKLGSYYGIDIQADPDLLKDKEATAVYHRKESWQQVLHHLLFIYHLSYKTGDRNIIIIKPS
ncbi:FecR family protein [Flavitalea flava]